MSIHPLKRKNSILAVALIVWSLSVYGQDLSALAGDFLNVLSADLRTEAHFTVDDFERYNWHFTPVVRKGPTFHDFNEQQTEAALALLRASLSQEGYHKIQQIMELEKVLKVMENNNHTLSDGTPLRDPLNYHFCIFGDPGSGGFWGWRFEGHHISLNFSSTDELLVSSTPSFWGSNPGVVKIDLQKGREVLKQESALGHQLIHSLNTEQRQLAIFSDKAPHEIITGTVRQVSGVEKVGIPYSSLDKKQKELFKELLEVYIGNYVFEFSNTFRQKIMDAGLENLTFAWAGVLDRSDGHYYRIHGPMLLIEFDNTQNNANHIHTVVRDLTNDFAEDLLKKHYAEQHR